MTEFVGAARPITADQVAITANTYSLELAAVRAVMAVESRNSGYDAKRRPLILFEPHIFYREITSDDRRNTAERAGLAYARWGQQPYPAGSDAQYMRLTQAIQIDEEAAYRSISMGMGQILGNNYKYAGCSSAKQMFEQAMESEANQLEHMLRFIVARSLRDDLRRHDWAGFARGYNGTGQVPKYAAWLEREYNKWVRILAKPRKDLDVKDLRDAGSKTVVAADSGKKAVGTVAGAGVGAAIEVAKSSLGPVNDAVSSAKQAKDSWGWIHENWQFILGGVVVMAILVGCYFAWQAFNRIQRERVQNARDGINARI